MQDGENVNGPIINIMHIKNIKHYLINHDA